MYNTRGYPDSDSVDLDLVAVNPVDDDEGFEMHEEFEENYGYSEDPDLEQLVGFRREFE